MGVFEKCIEILFPRLCFGCGKVGSYVCAACLEREAHPTCEYFSSHTDVDVLISATEYKGLFKRLITTSKYGSYEQVLIDVADKLISEKYVNAIPLDVRVHGNTHMYPVPMHPQKKRHRGFNQTESISRILSQKTGIPLLRDRLYKRVMTAPQASLTKEDRQINVKGAFFVRDSVQVPRTVILVDDVWTTGSTMREIAWLLKKSGVQRVIACTLARRWYNTGT